MFANASEDRSSISGRVIPKTQKVVTLSIIRYISRVKWRNSGKGVAPSPTLRCSSYWKRSFRVTLDYSRQLYLLYLLYDWLFRLNHHIAYIYYFLRLMNFFFHIVGPYGVVLCWYRKRFSFSKVSLSLPCPSLLMWDFACLSLDMPIQLFFVPFLLSSCCLCCFWSFVALFYAVFESCYRCIDAILNDFDSSSFSSWCNG